MPEPSLDPGLLAHARALVQRVRRGEFYGHTYRHPLTGQHFSAGDSSWAPLYDGLLARTMAAFQRGEAELARDAWQTLLWGLTLSDAFGGCQNPRELLTEDPTRHVAALSRAQVDLLGPEAGASAVARTLHELSPMSAGVVPHHIASARDPLPPEWRPFLLRLRTAVLQLPLDQPGWIYVRAALLKALPRTRDDLRRLEQRAALVPQRIEARDDLVDALVASHQLERAIQALDEGASHTRAHGIRARWADQKADLAEQLGDSKRTLQAYREAWDTSPTTQRLLRLLRAGGDASAEVERLHSGELDLPLDLAVRLELLAGEHDVALARIEEARPELWNHPDHPGSIVVPVLLRLGLGGRPVPPKSCVSAEWTALDGLQVGSADWVVHRARQSELRAVAFTEVFEGALAAHPDWRMDAPYHRAMVREQIWRRLDHAAQYKCDYAAVARQVAALAEVEALGGGEPGAAAQFLEAASRRHPRHRGLKRHIEEAAAASPVL